MKSNDLMAVVTVVVEDEERIRRYWREFFEERGMPIEVFDSELSFLGNYVRTALPTRFFFDQDFGENRGAGVRLARIVRNWPERVSTGLITAYPPALFVKERAEGVLDAVYPKFPPEIFGEQFFEKRFIQEFREKRARPVVGGSVERIDTKRREPRIKVLPGLGAARKEDRAG